MLTQTRCWMRKSNLWCAVVLKCLFWFRCPNCFLLHLNSFNAGQRVELICCHEKTVSAFFCLLQYSFIYFLPKKVVFPTSMNPKPPTEYLRVYRPLALLCDQLSYHAGFLYLFWSTMLLFYGSKNMHIYVGKIWALDGLTRILLCLWGSLISSKHFERRLCLTCSVLLETHQQGNWTN